MIHLEESVVIDRTPREVWAYVTDPVNDRKWMSNVLEYEADWEEEPRVGDRTRRVARVAGRRCEFTAEVTEVDPGRGFSWKSLEAPFTFQNGLRLQPTARGTRVTFWGRTPGMGGFFGRLADPVVARMFARDVRANLRCLKSLLESSPGRRQGRAGGDGAPARTPLA